MSKGSTSKVGHATNLSPTRISPIEFHAGAWVRGHDLGGELGREPTIYIRVIRAFDGANIGDLANGTG